MHLGLVATTVSRIHIQLDPSDSETFFTLKSKQDLS